MKGRRVRAFTCTGFLLLAGLVSCGPKDSNVSPRGPTRWGLFDKERIGHWKEAEMLHSGGVQQEAEGYTLKAGSPMTGLVYPAWEEEGLPLTDYRITYEAMRVSGKDFFASLTFPVGAVDRCVTFVLGGWGGSQVGISSIDGLDATMNATGSVQKFEEGKWYRIRIEVTAETLSVWLDDRSLARANIAKADLSLRAGEIDRCMPFGFASYGTEGRIRNCVVETLGANQR